MKLTASQKLVLALVTTVVALQASVGLGILVQQKQTLREQLDEHAAALVEIHTKAKAHCAAINVAETAREVGEAIARHGGVLFCEIRDRDDQVLFRGATGRANRGRQYTFPLLLDVSSATSQDQPVPEAATLSFSLAQDDMQRSLAQIRATVVTGVIAGGAVMWLLAALLVRDLFSRPIRHLLKKSRTTHALALTKGERAGGRDQLRQLAETLNAMDAELRRLAEREKKLAAHAVSGQIERQQITELKRAYAALEQVNQELDDFAYIVSHDLKAPLRHIKALVEWITADGGEGLPAKHAENFRLLIAQVDRMHSLIDGILQYSRTVRGNEERVTFDIAEAVAEAIELAAPPENIQIEVCDALPTLTLERTRLVQVFQNLLSNAIKFMDKPNGRIGIACREQENHWTFSVADNGPGIDGKHHEAIFRLFRTVRPSDEYESTGIGLTLVKKIVETCGGRIWVESRPGAGSTFFFTLPKEQKEISHEKLSAGTAC